jgi:endonuclease/exonuclease/phosphatase family metal-dependent hydrolase
MRVIVPLALLATTRCSWSPNPLKAGEPETIRVLTFNIWVGGESGKQPLDQTARVIQAARADIVGVQERNGPEQNGKRTDNARIIAEMLGWHYFPQAHDSTGILCRHEIVGHSPKKWGAQIELPSGRRVWMFNAHFAHAPYQPYQLLKIPYEDAPFIDTAEAAIREANKARGHEVAGMLAEIEAVRRPATAIFVTGDFNEPSPLDWTDAAYQAGRCPVAVKWPTADSVQQAGFTDAYRAAHPDPLQSPGHTWTPTTAVDDPNDRHDRIDFVFVSGPNVRVTKTEIVGERPDRADIVVTPYPSDHRGVVATVTLP